MHPSANMKPRPALVQSAPSPRTAAMSKALTIAGRADFYPITNPGTHECIMNEQEALAHWHAEVVGELDRGRPGSALCAIDDDEVGKDPGFAHRLDHSHELPWVSDTQLETDWLAIR